MSEPKHHGLFHAESEAQREKDRQFLARFGYKQAAGRDLSGGIRDTALHGSVTRGDVRRADHLHRSARHPAAVLGAQLLKAKGGGDGVSSRVGG